jgi:glutaredoxin
LNIHPHGHELQNYLGQVTGRRTVPNVIANGVSIGGGDEMRSAEASGHIPETLLKALAGKISVDGRSAL